MATITTAAPTRKRIARFEDERFVRGEGQYVGDIRIPGMLHVAFVRNVVGYGDLRGVDFTAARGFPGVVDTFGAGETDRLGTIPTRLPVPPGLEQYLQPPLASGRVRYVGQPVGVVVATSQAAAQDAAELVVVDVEPAALPPRELVYEDETAVGDVAGAFAGAAVVVREGFSIGRQSGLPLEPRGLLASYDPAPRTLTIWSTAKAPHHVRAVIAGALDLAPEQVEVRPVDAGGGFGVRGELHPEDLLVPLAAVRSGRAVRWLEERLEHLQSAYQSRDQRWEAALAVAADGTILGLDGSFDSDLGAFIGPNGLTPGRIALRSFGGPYRVPAYRCAVRHLRTCKPPLGTARGPGYSESGFVRERLVDLAAAELGIDPVELRRRNLVGPAEMPYDTGIDHVVLDGGQYGTALEVALAALEGGGETPGLLVGTGVACMVEATGTPGAETARARLELGGRIALTVGSSSFGQGHATTFAQVAADALGLEPEQVDVVEGDVEGGERSGGTFASRSAVMAGSACHEAALALREIILAHGAARLGGAVAIAEGRVCLEVDPASAVELADLAPLEASGTFTSSSPAFAYGSFAARAEVDPETGTVRLLELTGAVDAGYAINPAVVEGQLLGGAVHGLGGALSEELHHDADGQPLTGGLRDYHLPLAADVPRLKMIVLELVPSPRNPLGVRGVAEITTAGAGAAIANAVAAAMQPAGVSVTRLPIRPETLVSASPRP